MSVVADSSDVLKTLQFGCLLDAFEPMDIGHAVVRPIIDRAQASEWRERYVQDDDCIHGPIDLAKRREANPLMLTPTHALDVRDSAWLTKDRHVGMIFLHLLAACYDVRLQFSDWWEFGPAFARADIEFHVVPGEFACLLRRAMASGGALRPTHQAALAGALNLHGRIPGMHSAWQQFAWQYTVLDGCWKLLVEQGKVPDVVKPTACGHGDRLVKLDALVGGRTAQARLEQIYCRRNELLHECLEEGNPLDSGRGGETLRCYWDLRRLCLRLVFVLLEVECDFRSTPWSTRMQIGRWRLGLAGYVAD